MPIPESLNFDFRNPDYLEVFRHRVESLNWIKKHPEKLPGLKAYYRENIAQFIIDWGMTYDPRNVERGIPALCPFILFPKQEDWVKWFIDRWKSQSPGMSDKSRDMGLSWLFVATSCALCLFNEGLAIGFGSRKEEYVDKIGDPKSLLYKARKFMELLPQEFTGSWDIKRHAPHMRINFPDTQSIISGEAGDGIGRGDRASIYVVDEAAWLPRPELVEASLSQTTNCRIDVSTPRGMNNPFARKVHSGRVSVFTLHWRDDPRKDDAWYAKKCYDIDDAIVIAQEIDLDYMASISGVIIPAAWIQAATDAHIKLNVKPSGVRSIGFDVADEGKDKNAVCGRHGVLVEYLQHWSGKGDDIYGSVEKVFSLCEIMEYGSVDFDADGLGAGVRGDARIINSQRAASGARKFTFNAFRGSGEVTDPDADPFLTTGQHKSADVSSGRTNGDFFANYKAQCWWALRRRFQLTFRAVTEGREFVADDIISIPRTLPEYSRLITELSQPTYSQTGAGKLLVNKAPDNMPSPNLADAVMIAFAPKAKPIKGFFS